MSFHPSRCGTKAISRWMLFLGILWVTAALLLGPTTPNTPLAVSDHPSSAIPEHSSSSSQPNNTAEVLFHFVHTTDDASFGLHNLKALESVLYHHPKAQIQLHVHTDRFTSRPIQPLLDAGYQVALRPIDLEQTARQLMKHLSPQQLHPTTVQAFLQEIPGNYSKTPYWYTNQSNLLRLALMFLEGGVYLDTDMVLVKPFDSTLPTNVVGWEDKYHLKINMAAMNFQRPRNAFLAHCLQSFFLEFNPLIWGKNGPKLITRVWHRIKKKEEDQQATVQKKHPHMASTWTNDTLQLAQGSSMVTSVGIDHPSSFTLQVLGNRVFYPFRAARVKKWCFQARGNTVERIHRIHQQSWAVHTNHKNTATSVIQPGSVCEWLYQSFCVVSSCKPWVLNITDADSTKEEQEVEG